MTSLFSGSEPEAPTQTLNRDGAGSPLSEGELNPPPAAPLDRDEDESGAAPGAAQALPSATPTATRTSTTASSSKPTATATKKPSSATANSSSAPDPTSTPKPSSSAPSPTATKPPATATTAPPTVAPTPISAPTQVALAPTLALTQPPAPTATKPAPAATQPPAPTATPSPTATAPPPQSVSLHPMEAAMFTSHNVQRANNGVPALTLDAQLVAVARQRSQTMADTSCFSHTACGPTAFDLLGNIGYFYQIAGENIARNNYPDSQTVEVAMNGFIGSKGHYDNIMDSRYTKVGIGVAFGANGMKYFTVIFAGP